VTLQILTSQSAAFDEIYSKVPKEQVARLKEFRLTHQYKQLTVFALRAQCRRAACAPSFTISNSLTGSARALLSLVYDSPSPDDNHRREFLRFQEQQQSTR
jgi:hypothetical protein